MSVTEKQTKKNPEIFLVRKHKMTSATYFLFFFLLLFYWISIWCEQLTVKQILDPFEIIESKKVPVIMYYSYMYESKNEKWLEELFCSLVFSWKSKF